MNYTNALLEIRNKALALDSLAPGHGFDPLGFALCDIVQNSEMKSAEYRAVLKNIGSSILRDLQDISIRSEMLMEKAYAEKILNDIEGHDVTQTSSNRNKIQQLLSVYPYNWSGARVQYEIDLIRAVISQENIDHVVYIGRSMLPFSALDMHLETSTVIDWLDTHEESVRTAESFIQKLVEHDALSDGVINMRQSNDLESYFSKKTAAVIFLDDECMTEKNFILCHKNKIPFILVEPKGLCRIMYPDHEREKPQDHGFEAVKTVLAHHAYEELVESPIVTVAEKGMYVSLTAYKPV